VAFGEMVQYPAGMAPPPSAAALAPSPAAQRLAALLALPLREEPETPEEAAIFEQAEADLRAGLHSPGAGEVGQAIPRTLRDQGE
jgi:hypothetical protein